MTPIQCARCKHYRGVLRCAAFPDGVPVDLLTGEFDHADAYPGDGGIRFEEGTPTLDESLDIPETLPGGDTTEPM